MNNMVSGAVTSIDQMAGSLGHTRGVNNQNQVYNGPSFEDILKQKTSIEEVLSNSSVRSSAIKFSKHAGQRLEERDIQLSDEQMSRLEEGAAKASSKGIKESLVLIDDLAFIVNTQNRTVITAMDQTENDDNIYTNIDGAVVI